jgi:hypothetical protein
VDAESQQQVIKSAVFSSIHSVAWTRTQVSLLAKREKEGFGQVKYLENISSTTCF